MRELLLLFQHYYQLTSPTADPVSDLPNSSEITVKNKVYILPRFDPNSFLIAYDVSLTF